MKALLLLIGLCIVLVWAARRHAAPRHKIRSIWHGHVTWERNTSMLRATVSFPTTSAPVENVKVLPPPWLRGKIEAPAGEKDMGGWTRGVFTPEQQARLGVDENGAKVVTAAPVVETTPAPEVHKTMIAICAATHSKSTWRSLGDTALENLLIPSIEKTISTSDRSKYDFRLYLAADHDDQFWLDHRNNLKAPGWLSVHVGFYEVPKHKIPFNPMMRAAYDDGAEYMVRINDDSEFVTSGWISKAVAKLASYDPPNVGMVGPNCREGNRAIMTHDMVHRTHLDIFEHYYPDVFSAWWIDDWISKVYGPQRSTKMMDWTVKHHTHKHGTRYEVQHHEKQLLKGELEKGAAKIEKWLKTVEPIDKEQTVVIIGKGESAKPVQKTPDNIIVTINHALGFQPYSDIHFHLDWYFEDVPPDFFCRTKALVVPTYFHVCSSSCRFVHASLWLSKLKFDGPIFLVQLPDGPKDNDIEMWSGKRIVQSSGDLSFAWMLARGYRKFESYGIGGDGYANYYISKRYKQRFKLSWSTSASRIGHTQKRINEYGATWNKYLEPTTSMETPTKIDLGPCIHESGWDTLKDFGPSIMEAQKLGAGDDGVSVDIISKGTAVIPKLKRVSILLEENDSFDKGDIIVSVNTRLKTLKRAHIHFQLEIPKDNMDMNIADILVVPTYVNDGNKYVPIEDMLKKMRFRGPIFKIQLNNGPQNVLFESIKGDNYRDISHNWMYKRGYRLFKETFLGGGSKKGARIFKFPLKGVPHFQKRTSAYDTGFVCIRKHNISHMCETYERVRKNEREKQDLQIDWQTHWKPSSFSNPMKFDERFHTCVVLGSSPLTNIYNYSKYFSEADVVFAVNSKRQWVNMPGSTRVIETFDREHFKNKNFEANHNIIITSAQNLNAYMPSVKVALPSTPRLITKTAQLLGVVDPGYTSGYFVLTWAKTVCNTVNVIGFYGLSHYEHGDIAYSLGNMFKKTEKTGQFKGLNMLLRLNELGQINLIM